MTIRLTDSELDRLRNLCLDQSVKRNNIVPLSLGVSLLLELVAPGGTLDLAAARRLIKGPGKAPKKALEA
jgi:hypothetical protein